MSGITMLTPELTHCILQKWLTPPYEPRVLLTRPSHMTQLFLKCIQGVLTMLRCWKLGYGQRNCGWMAKADHTFHNLGKL